MLIDEIKTYLRVDDNESDTEIQILQLSAEEYLTNAGIAKNYNSNLYGIAVKLLVANWFENRGVTVLGKHAAKLEYMLDKIIPQLQLTQGDST